VPRDLPPTLSESRVTRGRLMEMRGLVVARPGPGGGVFATNPTARASASQLLLGFNWEFHRRVAMVCANAPP
jgi:hypothetical protein